MNGMDPQKGRYHCKFSGCDKSFQRREHLARHARTHSETRYICKVCQKEFTRSDSLQRHLGLHGEGFKPSPSGRSKRACVTCHASKIKCDGDQPCSRCQKKGVDCKYEQQDSDSRKVASNSGTPGPASKAAVPESTSLADNSGAKTVDTHELFEERLSAALSISKGPIDWSAVRIQPDSQHWTANTGSSNGVAHSTSENENWPSLPDLETKKYLDIYFTRFHPRWPVVHAPTFEVETAPPVLLSCVAMIGTCILGRSDSKELAMNLHTHVFNYIFPRLGQLSSEDSIDNSSTLGLCQASLLYIIFGFYCGRLPILSKAIIVRSMLVTVLREMGLFRPEMPVPYDKPGYFLPLRLVKEGQKQRLAICLFKIDTYLSILRGQPEILTPEELHFTLPSTFALWNSDGLNIWEIRHSIEPASRSQTTICRTILEPSLESFTPTDGLMLVEDIQLGICAVYSKLLQLLEKARDSPDNEVSVEKDALRRRLDSWKHWLLQIPIQQTDHIDFSQEQHLAMRYYYGIEDHSQPGWQLIVFDRPKNLIFDTLTLYHFLVVHLYADIRTLSQLAKDKQSADPMFVAGETYLKAQRRREDTTRAWVKSAAVRRVLCHATDILVSYSSISRLENNHVDPIAYVALSVSALVIWAYCMYGGKGCVDCAPEKGISLLIGKPVIELTKWSAPKTSQMFEKDKETWIETGNCQGALAGILLCRCNIDLLVAKFRVCIPEEWNVADTIAPGVFKPQS